VDAADLRLAGDRRYIIACVVITLAAAALLPDRSKTGLPVAPVPVPAGRATPG